MWYFLKMIHSSRTWFIYLHIMFFPHMNHSFQCHCYIISPHISSCDLFSHVIFPPIFFILFSYTFCCCYFDIQIMIQFRIQCFIMQWFIIRWFTIQLFMNQLLFSTRFICFHVIHQHDSIHFFPFYHESRTPGWFVCHMDNSWSRLQPLILFVTESITMTHGHSYDLQPIVQKHQDSEEHHVLFLQKKKLQMNWLKFHISDIRQLPILEALKRIMIHNWNISPFTRIYILPSVQKAVFRINYRPTVYFLIFFNPDSHFCPCSLSRPLRSYFIFRN